MSGVDSIRRDTISYTFSHGKSSSQLNCVYTRNRWPSKIIILVPSHMYVSLPPTQNIRSIHQLIPSKSLKVVVGCDLLASFKYPVQLLQ